MAVRFGSGGLQSVAPQTSKQVFKSAVAKAKRTGYSSGRSSGGGGGGLLLQQLMLLHNLQPRQKLKNN